VASTFGGSGCRGVTLRPMDREERVARNEAISREINEGIDQSKAATSAEEDVRMVCECGRPDCDRKIAITIAEYERVRDDPRTFAVTKDHVVPDLEVTVSETDRFIVVRKREGTPAEVAEQTDPRT
jgi:hypothetical protein